MVKVIFRKWDNVVFGFTIAKNVILISFWKYEVIICWGNEQDGCYCC